MCIALLSSRCVPISSLQWLSRAWLFATLWTAEHQASPFVTNAWSLPKLMSIESVMPSKHLIFFSSCLQSFPASGSFPVSQFFASGGQSSGVAASASVLPINIQSWFPLGWTGWISLQSKGVSRVFSKTTVQKHQFFCAQLSLESNSHIHTWVLEKTIALTRQTFVGRVMSLLFNMLSRLVTAFLLISRPQSPSAVILEPPPKINSVTCFHCFPIYFPWRHVYTIFFFFFSCVAICWAQLFCVIGYILLLVLTQHCCLDLCVRQSTYRVHGFQPQDRGPTHVHSAFQYTVSLPTLQGRLWLLTKHTTPGWTLSYMTPSRSAVKIYWS